MLHKFIRFLIDHFSYTADDAIQGEPFYVKD